MSIQNNQPLCAVYGKCGGCQYQHLSYGDEIALKEKQLKELFMQRLGQVARDSLFEAIIPSPQEYHYRNRLDLRLLKTRQNKIFIGFSETNSNNLIEINSCPIAMESISRFIPELKEKAVEKITEKYKTANLVVRSGQDNRVFWGGIGRRSLKMNREDYFWIEMKDKRIFYSLDSFFQANLSILPLLIEKIEQLVTFDQETYLWDLYGGVGFFGICLHDLVKKVVLIEENIHAVKIAQYNSDYNRLKNFRIIHGRVEEHFDLMEQIQDQEKIVAMIDPPRDGLSQNTAEFLSQKGVFKFLLYLSCNPLSLLRDLELFIKEDWQINRIIPFDFFPKTQHLETLVLLSKE